MVESPDPHFHHSMGKFTPTLEDVSRLTLLPMFDEEKAFTIDLEEAKVSDSSNYCFEHVGEVLRKFPSLQTRKQNKN